MAEAGRRRRREWERKERPSRGRSRRRGKRRGRAPRARGYLACHKDGLLVVVAVSVSLVPASGHDSAHWAESGSSQEGHHPSDSREGRTFLVATKRTRRTMTRAESQCSDEEMRQANSSITSLGVRSRVAGWRPQNPRFQDHRLSLEDPNLGRSVMARPAVEGSQVGAGPPSPSQSGRQLPWRHRGRRGPQRCVCGCGHQRMGRLRRGPRRHCLSWSRKEMQWRCCRTVSARSVSQVEER